MSSIIWLAMVSGHIEAVNALPLRGKKMCRKPFLSLGFFLHCGSLHGWEKEKTEGGWNLDLSDHQALSKQSLENRAPYRCFSDWI